MERSQLQFPIFSIEKHVTDIKQPTDPTSSTEKPEGGSIVNYDYTTDLDV